MLPDYSVTHVPGLYRVLSNQRCSTQALFGCDLVAIVILCLHLNQGVSQQRASKKRRAAGVKGIVCDATPSAVHSA